MVPIGECKYNLLVVMTKIGRIRIMDDKRASEAIRILACIVRVVPICSWLVDLLDNK